MQFIHLRLVKLESAKQFLARYLAWFFVVCMGFSCVPAQAQTTYSTSYTYSFTNIPPSWEIPSASATAITTLDQSNTPLNPASGTSWERICGDSINGDDDSSGAINFPSGFKFTFAGTAYTQFRIASNGSIQFSSTDQYYFQNYTPYPLPVTGGGNCTGSNSGPAPTNVLYAYWRDLTAAPYTASGSVKYELKGTSPNRYMLVTWDNVKQYNASSTNFSLQVALFESPAGINGDFEYRYISGSTNGLGTTIGVQVNSTDWFSYNPSSNNTTTAAPIDPSTGTSIRWTALTTPPTPAATYFFNEASYNGTAGEVIDSSGLGKHAKAVGGVTTVNTSTTCSASGRAANFPANTTASTITAIQTPVTVGYTGSVNFWYNGNSAWNDGSAEMLFDATNAANTAPFYLMKTTTGQLQFTAAANAASSTITAKSPAQTFPTNTLKHISVSWVFLPGTNQTYVQMFLDGVMVLNQRYTITTVSGSGYPNSGAFDTTRTINIGDSRNTTAPSGGTLNSANGWIDDFKVYSSQVNSYIANSDRSCTALVDHLEISAASSPMQPCKTNTITVKACKDAACTSTYNSGLSGTLTNNGTPTVTWDPSTGGATGADILTGGSGTASKDFQITTSGAVTIGLTSSSPLPANVTVCKFGSNAAANDCILTVNTNMAACVADFNCVETTANAATSADSAPDTGRLYTKLAGTAFTIDVVARKSDGSTATPYLSDAGKSVTVSLVDGSASVAGTTCTPTALSPAGPSSQTLTFVAGDSGRKSVTFTAPNAYKNVRCYAIDANATVTKACSQDNFAIRPPSASLGTAPAMATPPSASTANPIRAGSTFTLSATASAGTNYNPTLTLDTVTTPSLLTAQLTTNVTTPQSGGVVGTLTPASLVANAAAVNATYSEVGYLYLAAGAYYDNAASAFTAVDIRTSPLSSDCIVGSFSDTLSSGKYGCKIGTAPASFGRFIPDHFATAVTANAGVPMPCPTVQTCPTTFNGLVYSGQPYTLTVQAMNGLATPTVTQNYMNFFAKAVTLGAFNAGPTANQPGGATANPGSGALTTTNIAAGTATFTQAVPAFSNGVLMVPVTTGTITGAATGIAEIYTLPAALTAPQQVYIRATDTENITSLLATAANSIEGGVLVAQGRINVPNLVGSEKLGLCVPTAVQYYTGSSWTTSLTDSATSFNTSLCTTGVWNVATPPASTCAAPAGASVMSNATGMTNGTGLTLITSGTTPVGCAGPGPGAATNGIRRFRIASNNNTAGISNITIVNGPAYLPSTTGRMFFGGYKSPVIDIREVFR